MPLPRSGVTDPGHNTCLQGVAGLGEAGILPLRITRKHASTPLLSGRVRLGTQDYEFALQSS
jgi:hypothetical protein